MTTPGRIGADQARRSVPGRMRRVPGSTVARGCSRTPAFTPYRSIELARGRQGWIWRSGGSASIEQGGDELVGIELDQIRDPLAHPDELYRDTELVADRQHDAALGRAI